MKATRIDIDDMKMPLGFQISFWDEKISLEDFAAVLEASAGVTIETETNFNYRRAATIHEVEICDMEMSGSCFAKALIIWFDEYSNFSIKGITGRVYRARSGEKNFYVVQDTVSGREPGQYLPIYFTLD